MRRSKQVTEMIAAVNNYLRENHIKRTADPQFTVMCWLLIEAHCYNGFNYFTADNKLAGGRNDQFDHLEIY